MSTLTDGAIQNALPVTTRSNWLDWEEISLAGSSARRQKTPARAGRGFVCNSCSQPWIQWPGTLEHTAQQVTVWVAPLAFLLWHNHPLAAPKASGPEYTKSLPFAKAAF